MDQDITSRITSHDAFQTLVRERGRFTLSLTVIMLMIYFAFILLVAFAPTVLARPMGTSLITLGIPVGVGIIVSAFILAGWYVHRANTRFDALIETIRRIEG